MHTHWARLPAGGGPEAGGGTTSAPRLLCTIYDARLLAKRLPKNTTRSLTGIKQKRRAVVGENPVRCERVCLVCLHTTGT